MNSLFILAGVLNAIAAALHVGCIYFGAPWYRFFGAGEALAVLAEQGSIRPAIVTSGIVVVLSIFSLYSFSAAGLMTPLPWLRLVIVAITSIYLIRGIAGLFLMKNPMGRSPGFWLWSSVICLSVGVIHLVALKQEWTYL